MLYKERKRIEFLDDVIFYKTIIVEVTLDRYKDYELTIKDFNIKVNGNSKFLAFKEVKDILRKLHKDYLENKIEDEKIKNLYSEYLKPYKGRSEFSQKENIQRLREERDKNKNK